MIVLGERLTLAHAIGACCIISGIFIASRLSGQAKKRVAPAGGGA
jgi:drug/metabolite transporter (DMT)-like permease